jgi:hypothetical protein
MDFSNLTRDAKYIMGRALFDDVENKKYIAIDDIDIYFPKHYLDGKLGSIDSKFNPLGIFAIVSGDKYAVHSVPAIIPMNPSNSTIVKINDMAYYKLSWSKGETVVSNTLLVKRQSLAFEIYDEFIAKGRVPPYLNKRDYVEILYHIQEFCDVNLNTDPAILAGYGAATARYPDDQTKPAREFYVKQADFIDMPIVRIPLRSVAYGADNTTARLLGSYLNEGLMSSLVNRSDGTQNIEQILTS